jgi:DNA-binding NarL/FixJ family response regulator
MRQRHLLTCGLDDKLSGRLHQWVQHHGIGLRAVRQPDACLSLLRQGAVGVLVLRLGRDLENEYALLAQVAQQFPHVRKLVIGEVDHPPLAGLAWDLGADCVLVATEELDRLGDVIAALFEEES